MSVIGSNILAGASGQDGAYEIARSLRFNDGDTAYLDKTFSSAGNRQAWTWSAWVKRSDLGTDRRVLFGGYGATNNTDWLEIGYKDNGVYATVNTVNTTGTYLFRDPSAWYHYVVNYNGSYVKWYINGDEVHSWARTGNLGVNGGHSHTIGKSPLSTITRYHDGYLAEVNFIDGQTLDGSSFAETDSDTGAWIPKKYSGSYGTNGFYLNFSDNSGVTATTLGKDSSGNGNNWTPNNFSVTAGADNDSLEDTPTNNFCTMNALAKGTDATLSNGNLDVAYGSASTRTATIATMGMSSGKWYWEHKVTSHASEMFGITNVSDGSQVSNYPGFSSNGWGIDSFDGQKYHNATAESYGSAFVTDDVIGCAFDADNGKLWWSKNGTFFASGDPAAGTNAAYSSLPSTTYYPAVGDGGATGQPTFSINFGQRAFDYTPPTGFKSLNTANLPVPTIKNGTEYFNTVLYTGAGGTQSVTGVGFQPDFAWFKRRNASAEHGLHDAVRGVRFSLSSDGTGAELDRPTYVTSFDTDGFSFGDNVSNYNSSGSTYVAWNWKAGGSGSANTDGSISSTVSVNVNAGFSIVTYTGDGNTSSGVTIGHGLGVTPDVIITKMRSSGTDYGWSTWHKDLGGNYGIWLDKTNARNPSMWGGHSSFSSTVFTPADQAYNNVSGKEYVNYCFAEVEGYSKFGSYTGNGSSDGVFIYLGFKPAFVIFKGSSIASNWCILDATRDTFNVTERTMQANSSAAELTTLSDCDFLSNGIKIRSVVTNDTNVSGQTYIYMAFAEAPFKYANAR